MGGSGKSTESNTQLENAQVTDANALTTLAQGQAANANTLFNLGLPGLQTSENQASVLASGDPDAIAKLIAPATQQIQTATAGAKQNILNTAPAGGEKNLAIEQADANQGAQVGALASQGYNNAFNSLAQLGGANVNANIASAGTATSAFGQANNALSNVVGENIQQKGATLGAFGSLGSDVVSGVGGGIGAAAGGSSGLASLAAGLLAF